MNSLRRLIDVGIIALGVACAPVASPNPAMPGPSTPQSAQTVVPTMPSIPPTLAPIGLTAQCTPTLTTSAADAPITPHAVSSCRETQGHQSVMHFDSATLARRVAYSLYLPPCYDTDPKLVYPVLYLLHGVNADNTQWLDLDVVSRTDSLVAQHTTEPFVIVMPDGDYRAGEDYAAFVLRDLMPYVEQTWHVSRERTHRAIGGLSRGGYWALYVALTHPELFAAVGGHSPVTTAALTETLALTTGTAARSALRIYLDVGRNDPLAPTVTPFAATVQAQHAKTIFHLYDGRHDRDYWRAHVAEYLAFYAAEWHP